MEFSRLGVESELQPQANTTATAMQDPSWVCNLHHSSQQGQILNPLSEHLLMDTSQICFCCAAVGTPRPILLLQKLRDTVKNGSIFNKLPGDCVSWTATDGMK